MIDGLHLTKHEERVLRSLILGQRPDPISQFFQLPFFRRRVVGFLGAMAVVLSAFAIFGFLVYLSERAFGDGYASLVLLLLLLVIEGMVDRWFRIPARERLILKLYRVIDGELVRVSSSSRDPG